MHNKKEIINLINSNVKAPTPCNEIVELIGGTVPRSTLFRYINRLIKSGDVIYFVDRKKHPRNFPTRYYMPNNLKTAKKVKQKQFIN